MKPLLKSLLMKIPAVRKHFKRVEALSAERDQLRWKLDTLTREAALDASLFERPEDGWKETKARKRKLSEEFRGIAASTRMTPIIQPAPNYPGLSTAEWIRHQVEAEPYWFQKIEVLPGLYSRGWSDPRTEKLPFYGLPEDLTGMRVLDIGCAEGFFSFEAEKRGAREVIGIDSFPDSIRRFNIVKAARQSNATAFLMNVYDLEPKRLGTFDLLLFYGVFYHLKHPQYALERIRSVCTGRLLFQTHIHEEPSVKGIPWARFYPHGIMSGKNQELFDPTVFWLFNSACCLAILDHVGFTDLRIISTDPNPFVISSRVPDPSPGAPPDQAEAPWC